MELLTSTGTPRVYGLLKPGKVVERVKLGEVVSKGEKPRLGIRMSDVVEAFFAVVERPRLLSAEAIQNAITKGVSEGLFGYTSGTVPALGQDGIFQVSAEKVALGKSIPPDEVDLETGFLMAPSAMPQAVEEKRPETTDEGRGEVPTPTGVTPVIERPTAEEAGKPTVYRKRFKATRDQVFKVFPAIANLADKSDGGKVTIDIEGTASKGYDPSWLRNAVNEPLDEADVEDA